MYRSTASPAYTHESPDKRYRIVVYRLPMLYSGLGQGSDAPGFARLYDKQGRLLEECELVMIQFADVRWSADEVSSTLGVYWKLP